MKPFPILILLICYHNSECVAQDQVQKFPYGSYLVDYGGCRNRDSLEFLLVGENLYMDNNNKLYFLSRDCGDEMGDCVDLFISRFPNECYNEKDESVDNPSYDLGNIIDISTFRKSKKEGDYKDKYHSYHFTSTADGGHLKAYPKKKKKLKTSLVTYTELEKGFYLGSDSKMYILTESYKCEKRKDCKPFFREVPFIDVATYKQSWGRYDIAYAKDTNHVYIWQRKDDGEYIKIIEQADAGSFEELGFQWARDKEHVFCRETLLEGLDPDSLIIICPRRLRNGTVWFNFVRDSDQLFYGPYEITGVDAASLTCIETDVTTFVDKDWIYTKGFFPTGDEQFRTKR